MKRLNLPIIMLTCMVSFTCEAYSSDYLTFLTTERGFTEITSLNEIMTTENDYYILTSAENSNLIVGIGRYEAKPSWASEDTKALRYVSAEKDPMLDATNFFTIEKNGTKIGFRNIVYSADLFQTHNGSGFMYVNTYTDKNLDEWSFLNPTYQDDYWLFESGKYPISGGDNFSGYLGPWNNQVAENEALALNRKNTPNDEAGHFRIFHISKSDFERGYRALQMQLLQSSSSANPVDATWLITNASFETGDVKGWTRNPNVTNDNEFNTRDYGMTGKEGGYLFNAYQWWASNLGISQTVENVPSGSYELSAVMATWAGRTVTLRANNNEVCKTGINDATGIPVTIPITIGTDQQLHIITSSTGSWWLEGHESETQTFFKLDNVKLTCFGVFLNGIALPLPNDNDTKLVIGQWYYYDIPYSTEYLLRGQLSDIVCSTDGEKFLSDVTSQPIEQRMTFNKGRVYFKPIQADATLSVTMERKIEECTFTATALNVDGLPQKILFVTVNEDGPGEDGTKKISKYLHSKGYDIIGVSEDFNYHGSLMSELSNDYNCGTHRGSISITDFSYPFDTDGLNLIWKKNTISTDNENWTRWTETTATDGNQYVKKGFRHYDVTIGEDMEIDLYVLHMDAGEATQSREAQWEQLAQAVKASDSTRPKIILGDTNSRWTREDIHRHFFQIVNQNTSDYTISDAWVELCRNNEYPTVGSGDLTDDSDPTNYANYEVVDKIIYINPNSPNLLQLSALSFKIEQDYTYGMVDGTDSAKPLGDHRPIVVEFSCIKSGDANSLMGDVNRDGTISVSDVMAAVNIVLGNDYEKPYIFDHLAADPNYDGRISIADVMAIVQMVLD